MARRHDWAARMFDVIGAHRALPFEWASNNCCLFPARVIDAMTGSTFAAAVAAAITDEVSALAFIAEHGGLAGAVSVFLGEPVEARATRGDVVAFAGGDGEALAVCTGTELIGVGPTGLHAVPRYSVAITHVWPIA